MYEYLSKPAEGLLTRILTCFPFLDFLDLDLATEDCLDIPDKTDPGPDMFEQI